MLLCGWRADVVNLPQYCAVIISISHLNLTHLGRRKNLTGLDLFEGGLAGLAVLEVGQAVFRGGVAAGAVDVFWLA